MDKKRQIVLAVMALLVVVSAALGYSFTAGREGAPPARNEVEVASVQEEQSQNACSSAATYARLKEVAFEQALKMRQGDTENLDTLATHSVVRMENPVVKSRDEDLNVTVCTGRFIVELPPGAERAFGGERRLAADIEYSAQAAADGSGLVYEINGAEPIVQRLAGFDLQGRQYLAPDQVQLAEAQPATPPVPEAEAVLPPPVAVTTDDEDTEEAREGREEQAERLVRLRREQREAREEQAERAQEARERRAEQAREAREKEQRRAERTKAAEPKAREQRTARASARPSFNCGSASTRSEKMVCSSSRLAAHDRQMSSMFYSALADADPRTRRELRRTRDRFLAYRERCRSEDCVAGAYEGRMREIRDIVAESE